MSITALNGPVIQKNSNSIGSVGTGGSGQNPDAGPSLFNHTYGLLDPRYPFTYGGAAGESKCYGFMQGPLGLQCIDQAPAAISATNLANAVSPTGGTAITLTAGTGVTSATSITRADTGATVTGLFALDTAMSSVPFGQATGGTGTNTINIWDPTKAIARNIRITSSADASNAVFTVAGYDLYGYPMSEAITGLNTGVASGLKAFKYIASVTPNNTPTTGTISIGTGDVIGLPIRADRIPYASIYWGNPQSQIVGPGGTTTAAEQVIVIPVVDVSLINSAVFKADVPFAFTLKSAQFRTGQIATGASAAATVTATVGGTAITGGVLTLTLASQNASGNTVAASAMSGAATTSATGTTIEWTVSGVTAWTAGTGYIEMVVVNNELAGGTFTGAVTTSPATTTTGDVRGTIALPTASDGTKRLTVFVSPSVANASPAVGLITGLFGVAQNTANNNGA